MENQDLDVLNLKKQEENKSYDKLDGTGVKPLRVISNILIALGVFLLFGGIMEGLDANRYHPEKEFFSFILVYTAIVCFIISPLFKVLATIGEAAKIYKDKNCN